MLHYLFFQLLILFNYKEDKVYLLCPSHNHLAHAFSLYFIYIYIYTYIFLLYPVIPDKKGSSKLSTPNIYTYSMKVPLYSRTTINNKTISSYFFNKITIYVFYLYIKKNFFRSTFICVYARIITINCMRAQVTLRINFQQKHNFSRVVSFILTQAANIQNV